jgi:hypothetical protein
MRSADAAISTLAANGCHDHRHGARISRQLDPTWPNSADGECVT